MMELLLSAAISAGAYLILPDILSQAETILFLITGIVVSFMTISWIKDQVERIQRKRRSLIIRKARRRHQKIVDFPVRPYKKIIPAFKVAK